MKKVILLLLAFYMLSNMVFAYEVRYGDDGNIHFIGNKRVNYWSDGKIRSIDE